MLTSAQPPRDREFIERGEMIGEVRSPFEAVERTALTWGERDALHIPVTACADYAAQPITYSYAKLYEAVLSASAQWSGAAVCGRIALVLENRPEFFIHWLALNALGISVIPLNHELRDEEIPYYLEHGGAVALVCLEKHFARMSRICGGLSDSIPCVTPDGISSLALGGQSLDKRYDHDLECALLYTSGSTGKPKGCILSNDYFVQQGIWYRRLGGHISLQPGRERLLTPLPLSHMNAMSVSTMAMFMTAGCLVQLDRFHPSTWWQSVRDSDATALHYLGVLPAILLALPESDRDSVAPQVRFGFGAGVNPAHHDRFEKRFGFPLVEAWAMTECGAGGAIIAADEPRHVGECCFGKPSEAIDWQIVDDSGLPVDKGQPGELRVRAAGKDPKKGFFSGYLSDPEATEEVWQSGWLNTGDVVSEMADGSLVFVDRKKNIIRRSGENISALEVEAVASAHAAIKDVIATSVADDFRGEEVALCVVLKDDTQCGAEVAQHIQQHVLQNLAYFKSPGWVVFVEEMPVTASNKPRRAEIKRMAASAVTSGAAHDLRTLKVRQ